MSILVEAGGGVNEAFLPYIDKLYHFIAPKILGDNSGKSCFYGANVEKKFKTSQGPIEEYLKEGEEKEEEEEEEGKEERKEEEWKEEEERGGD